MKLSELLMLALRCGHVIDHLQKLLYRFNRQLQGVPKNYITANMLKIYSKSYSCLAVSLYFLLIFNSIFKYIFIVSGGIFLKHNIHYFLDFSYNVTVDFGYNL